MRPDLLSRTSIAQWRLSGRESDVAGAARLEDVARRKVTREGLFTQRLVRGRWPVSHDTPPTS